MIFQLEKVTVCHKTLEEHQDIPQMLNCTEILGIGRWVDILSFLSHLFGHSRQVFALAGLIILVARALPSVSTVAMRGCSCSPTKFRWVVHAKWHPHECEDPRFPRRT